MEKRPSENNNEPMGQSEKEKENEYIKVFQYFENANIRNRNAFVELLNYTIENRRDPDK